MALWLLQKTLGLQSRRAAALETAGPCGLPPTLHTLSLVVFTKSTWVPKSTLSFVVFTKGTWVPKSQGSQHTLQTVGLVIFTKSIWVLGRKG